MTAFYVSPIEMIVLIGVIGILIALLCWLGWIVFNYAFRFIKEKIDCHIGKRVRFHDRRREQEIEHATRFFGKVEKGIGKGVKGLWDGLTKNEAWMKREFGERSALLRENLNVHDGAGESRRYGYHEGMVFNDQERGMYMDGDGTSENCPALG
ncbi:hypothetical protein EG329_000389 [Mollisiaceae sp. DMI_Dod_QoI]|nr:hypothetical protein EG329_000389 [Helotiales sp. DMI_Dod_QoI]